MLKLKLFAAALLLACTALPAAQAAPVELGNGGGATALDAAEPAQRVRRGHKGEKATGKGKGNGGPAKPKPKGKKGKKGKKGQKGKQEPIDKPLVKLTFPFLVKDSYLPRDAAFFTTLEGYIRNALAQLDISAITNFATTPISLTEDMSPLDASHTCTAVGPTCDHEPAGIVATVTVENMAEHDDIIELAATIGTRVMNAHD